MRGFFPNLKSIFVLYGRIKTSVNTFLHLMFKMKQEKKAIAIPALPPCQIVLQY